MRKIVILMLAATILFALPAFVGSAMVGMGDGSMEKGMRPCIGSACPLMPAAPAEGCLDHCLSAMAWFTAALPTAPLLATTMSIFFVVIFFATVCDPLVQTEVHRWRNGIGKVLLRQRLATVILRN
jgi:hypothetical protein